MGRLLLRTAAIAGVVVLALVLWVVIARPVSMFLDRFRTAEIESHPILALGFDIRDSATGSIQLDDRPMSLMPANDQLLPLHVEISESGDFAVMAGPSSITLGHAKQSSVDPNIFSVKPAAADRTVFRIGRSMMSWPTPLAFNFMTGHSPSWKRHNYYELVWQKQNGSRLKMVWRYEQYFYDSWASGFMVRDGITGLIRAEIRP
ncbi:MAG: hypothetical protein DMF03_09500 [Verrucomicrobia bacterium]|nr:MAG: hypothetical protein DMF03_09500 [Verrucomicrobiota bacterium]